MTERYQVFGYKEGNPVKKFDETFDVRAQASKVANHLSDEGWSITFATIPAGSDVPSLMVMNDLDFIFGKTRF